ncbi:MAG: type II toxin-antitoxin system RelE/ParE family toxin [Nanoarchaeota archaeon]
MLKEQIWKKIQQLKIMPLLGKKLIGNPYWSLRVGNYRVIYCIDENKKIIEILHVIPRKNDYREID